MQPPLASNWHFASEMARLDITTDDGQQRKLKQVADEKMPIDQSLAQSEKIPKLSLGYIPGDLCYHGLTRIRIIMAVTESEKEIEKQWGVDADTLYRSIGHFVFNFSRFEDVVRGRYVAHLEFNDTQRQFVMPAMDFAFLCGSCKLLFEKTYSGKKTQDTYCNLERRT